MRNRLGVAMSWRAPLVGLALLASGCDYSTTDASRVALVFGGIGMGRGEFAYPRGIAVSPVDGRVFIVDKAARIQRFDARGAYETEWRMPEWENGKPTGLCVDRRNRVWVADTHYARVIEFDRDGHELRRFGGHGDGPGQFIWPTNIAIDAGGSIFVGEYGGNDRISRFSPELRYELSFAHGPAEAGGTNRPQGLVFDAKGVLWVADASNHRICRYTRDGAFLGAFGVVGDRPGEFRYPYDVAIARDGTVFVSDYGNSRLVRLDADGQFLSSWGGMGREQGRLRHPWSLDFGPDGRLYVLDSWNSRVQVLTW